METYLSCVFFILFVKSSIYIQSKTKRIQIKNSDYEKQTF